MANEFCGKCGASLNGAQFCSSCGAAAEGQVTTQPKPQAEVLPAPVYSPVTVYTAPAADVPPPKGGRYSVMGTGSFMGSMLLFSIPVIGFIFMVVWACGGCTNQNKRNFARAYLIWLLIGVAVTAAIALIFMSFGTNLWDVLRSQFSGEYFY